MNNKIVSVICLCYNHEKFVEESIASVLNQSYHNVEIIVVDDNSIDKSRHIIQSIIQNFPEIKYLALTENIGNCKAFNQGLKLAMGEFIIDMATDDVMEPKRIEKQVDAFNKLSDEYGIVHTDAIYIDEDGSTLYGHFKYLRDHGMISEMPDGNIYCALLRRYFVASPTMMIRKKVFDELRGYDENLAYEDFDFWIRSARNWKYAYLNEPLTRIRRVQGSLSAGWYVPGDAQLHSTYLICKKAIDLNRNDDEKKALVSRVHYELRQSVFSENRLEAQLFYALLKEMKAHGLFSHFLMFLNTLHLPLSGLRRLYYQWRYGG